MVNDNNVNMIKIVPVKPKVLSNEQIYVYVPKASVNTPGISRYDKDQFTVTGDDSLVKLLWPVNSFAAEDVGPIEVPSLIKVLDTEFEYTNVPQTITNAAGEKLTLNNVEVKFKRTDNDVLTRPDFIMLDYTEFKATKNENDYNVYRIKWPIASDPTTLDGNSNNFGLMRLPTINGVPTGYLKYDEDGNLIVNYEELVKDFYDPTTQTLKAVEILKNSKPVATQESLNIVNNKVNQNTSNILSNTTRIAKLEQFTNSGETSIGQISQEEFPTDEELNAYVQLKANRAPKSGDVIIFVQILPGTDQPYKYTFGASGWERYPIPLPELSFNNSPGLVAGSYDDSFDELTKTDIVAGIIKGIYVENNGEYVNIRDFLKQNAENITLNSTEIENIKNGTTTVGNAGKLNNKTESQLSVANAGRLNNKLESQLSVDNAAKLGGKTEAQLNVNQALSAIRDAQGNIIDTTYTTQARVEAYVQEYSQPKKVNDVRFISANGYIDNAPTTPADGTQFTAVSNIIGTVLLAEVQEVTEANFSLSSKNTANNTLWLKADRDCKATVRLTTRVKKASGGDWTDLAIEVSNELQFTANILQSVSIFSVFSLLGTSVYKVDINDIIGQKIEIITTDSEVTNWILHSNQTRASIFYLNAQALEININTIGGSKKVVVTASEFVLNESTGLYDAVISQAEHGQPIREDYMISARIDNAGVKDSFYIQNNIDAGGNITISVEEPETIEVYIASERDTTAMGITTLINPNTLTGIDYNSIGTIKIIQSEVGTPLTLEAPSQANMSYSVFVYNDKSSINDISINGETLSPDSGIKFNWVGEWQVGEMPDKTSEITDDVNNQPLNTTLAGLRTDINKNTNDITTINENLSTLENQVNTNIQDIADINTMIARELKVVGSVDFKQNGTTPIQTITGITSTNLIPIDLSTAVLDVANAPSKADGTIQASWLDTPYNSGATPQNLVFYSSSMPIRANADGSVLLINPIIGQNTKVNVVLSYTKATNTSLTMGIVVLNTTTGEVVRYPQLATITNATTGSVEYPSINLTYKANDKYVLFVQPTFSGGSLTNVAINKVTLTTDFYPLDKGE